MKKVVVFFHYPQTEAHGQKIFLAEAKKILYVDNTHEGNLIIRTEPTENPEPSEVIAVFKDWIYWEKLE